MWVDVHRLEAHVINVAFPLWSPQNFTTNKVLFLTQVYPKVLKYH